MGGIYYVVGDEFVAGFLAQKLLIFQFSFEAQHGKKEYPSTMWSYAET